MIRKVQKEHVPETESDCKTRSNFRALFYRVSRAFGCDQNVHVALVTRGARRSKRNLPYVTITHSYVLAFFATRFLLLFRSHFCRNCSFTRRYQHGSVLEPFPHFGRRTTWNVASLTFTRKCLLLAFDCGCGNGFLFSRRPRPVSDRCRSFASVRKMTSEARIRREKKKIRSFCVQTVSLEPWRSRHFGLLSRPEPCRSESVLFLACSQFWRPSWRHCSWERCQSDIHSNMFAPCFRLRMWEWLSLSRRPRPVSQSLQSALSWFQSALTCFVCSVLRFADAGMAFSLAKDRDLSRCGIKCPSESHWSHAVGRVRSFYQTLRECWMWKTPFCVVNSLQSHWRRGKWRTFFVECCQRLGPVKDTVLRRELASIIALATRKTKNFFRGMLSAFRAGRCTCECRRWFSQPLLPGHMLSSVSVAWSDILSSIRRSHWLTGAAGNGAMCNKLKMIALLEKRLELDRRNHGKNGHHFHISAIFFSCTLTAELHSLQVWRLLSPFN